MDEYTNKKELTRYPAPVGDAQIAIAELSDPQMDFDESPALRHYLNILVHRKWAVIGFFLAFLAFTVMVILSWPATYVGRGSVQVIPSTPRVTKFENVVNINELKKDSFTKEQVTLFQSPALAQRVIERLHLDKNPAFNKAIAEPKSGFFPAVKRSISNTMEAAQDYVFGKLDANLMALDEQHSMEYLFTRSLNVQQVQADANIISVSFNSGDRTLARDITNALLDEFIKWQVERRLDSTKIGKEQLEQQIRAARNDLEMSQGKLSSFAEEAGIASLESKGNLVYQQLEEMTQALAKAKADTVSKKEFYAQARISDISSWPLVLQNSLIQNLKTQHIALTSEYEKMRVNFKDDYPTVKDLKAKMADIGRRIELEQNRLLTSYKNEYLTAAGIEKALQSEAEEKKVLAMQLNVQANQYKVLQGEVEANTTIYQALLRRIKEIEANAATDLSSVEIVSLAELPVRPFMPNIPLFLLAGTVLGLMGGMGLAFLREHLDDTVRRTEEIERHSIPILGVIPLATKDEVKRLDSMIYHDPSSVFSEALRFTKLSVELSASVDHPAKSLLITSTASNDGKSTIAANLAQAFAASGERVLLMDADLQGPSLYHSFISNGKGNGNGGHNGIGLAGYLNGDNRFEEILQKTDVPNLHFISSGPVTRNQTQLLNSGKMKSLMNVLGNHFDRIIVDAPPFGSEVLFLGNMVHGVVLIANLGETNREALRVFLRNMQQVRGRLLGIVVNKLNMSRYYGDYYYKYFRNNYSTSKSKHKVRSRTFES